MFIQHDDSMFIAEYSAVLLDERSGSADLTHSVILGTMHFLHLRLIN